MGFSYLKDKNWSDITREERFFCAELYSAIKDNEAEFVKWLISLGTMNKVPLNPDMDWEIAFEVSFYRDLFMGIDPSAENKDFSPKRTFDFCLFSEDQIVIIEAKAHGKFRRKQLDNLENDKLDILFAINSALKLELDNTDIDVKVVALASSRYFKNMGRRHGPENKVPDEFDGYFTWKDVYESFCRREVFIKADDTYGNGKHNNSNAQK